jgi:hypothetical protein
MVTSPESQQSSRLNKLQKALRVSPALLAMLALGCGEKNNLKQAEKIARHKYNEAYRHTDNPVDKFRLQYLLQTRVVIKKDNGDPIQIGDGRSWVVKINNGCLGGSAFNVAGGDVTASAHTGSLLSSSDASATANIPTAIAYAVTSHDDPDELTVKSGRSDAPELHFSGVQSTRGLRPMDEQTEEILESYGCKRGVVGHSIVYTGDVSSSDYIK